MEPPQHIWPQTLRILVKWTALCTNGLNHLGLWVNGPSHLWDSISASSAFPLDSSAHACAAHGASVGPTAGEEHLRNLIPVFHMVYYLWK